MYINLQPINTYSYHKKPIFCANPINNSNLKEVKKEVSNISTLVANNDMLNKNILINFDNLKKLGIANLQAVGNKGVRGESLSASRNFKYLSKMKENGIYTIIDLRTDDHTEKFKDKCTRFGLNYIHIPFDEKKTGDREILDNLPVLMSKLDEGHFYIACAQGRHRTDIALATNYLFNPKHSKIPPTMYGHLKNGQLRCQDLFTRINSLYKNMTNQDKEKFGWTEEFEHDFIERKKRLKLYNESLVI